jgi:hypothetical protein
MFEAAFNDPARIIGRPHVGISCILNAIPTELYSYFMMNCMRWRFRQCKFIHWQHWTRRFQTSGLFGIQMFGYTPEVFVNSWPAVTVKDSKLIATRYHIWLLARIRSKWDKKQLRIRIDYNSTDTVTSVVIYRISQKSAFIVSASENIRSSWMVINRIKTVLTVFALHYLPNNFRCYGTPLIKYPVFGTH